MLQYVVQAGALQYDNVLRAFAGSIATVLMLAAECQAANLDYSTPAWSCNLSTEQSDANEVASNWMVVVILQADEQYVRTS